jgi:hypothetical protein
VSPHDGPTSSGPYVWDNNNLGQKNITIRNARPGERILFPFRIGHPQMTGLKQTIVVNKVKAPANINVAFTTAKPDVINSVAAIGNLLRPTGPEPANPAVLRPAAGGGVPGVNRLPFRMTFLEEARVSLSSGTERENGESLLLTLPANSTIELGAPAPIAPSQTPSDDRALYEEPQIEADGRAERPFSLATINDRPALLLNPSLKQVAINLPAGQAEEQESTLAVDVPPTAKPGDSYVFDVEQRDGQGVRTGGVRLRLNVVAEG